MSFLVQARHRLHKSYLSLGERQLSTSSEFASSLRRSYQYVPSSNPKMLRKSLQSPSDTIIYDLEDSVSPLQKAAARVDLTDFLKTHEAPSPQRYAVRVNAVDTEYFAHDMQCILSHRAVEALVLPKIYSARDLSEVARHVPSGRRLNVVASIESARSLWNIGEISSWNESSAIRVVGLLFAAEDYCADTGILRSRSRQELLYTRSRIVNAAKAFGLQAIDMVCVNYKDMDYLRDECEDGRRLGFDGKQAIHPAQVETIQSAFAPTEHEIQRAALILAGMEKARKTEARGAFGLETPDGHKEMIDEPMVKQALSVIARARAAGLQIPLV